MKYKHIATALITLSLLAVTFLATARAADITLLAFGVKQGKNFTFTIDANIYDEITGDVLYTVGNEIDTSSILLTLTDTKNVDHEIEPDWTQISVAFDGSFIEIHLVKQDGIPTHGNSMAITGSFKVGGPYDGLTFEATGPGWGWANIH
jgi:hypothetical protein